MKRRVFVLALLAGSLAVVPAHAQKDSPAVAAAKKAGSPKLKPQTALASKGAFPVVKAADAKVKGAHAATDLAGAKKLVGKMTSVVGTVSKVFMPRSNSIVILNFAKDYKTAMTAVVNFKDYGKFPALGQLEGKKVLLMGKVVVFKDAPEVMLDKAGTISIVK